MNKLLIILMAVALVPAFASAAGPVARRAAPAASSGEPTIDSCGLGWQVTDKHTFLATTTRGTTNAFIPPTFGMTSGTIGCEQLQFAKNEEGAVNFAVTNYDSITQDMASGRGEYLVGFARTMGCSSAASQSFGQMTQKNYKNIVGQGGSLEMYQNVKAQIQQDAVLSISCGV